MATRSVNRGSACRSGVSQCAPNTLTPPAERRCRRNSAGWLGTFNRAAVRLILNERAAVAAPARTLEGPDVRTLMEAFGFMFSLCLDHQAERLRRGEKPDDFIDPKTLNPLARSYLREAFRAVASVQSGLVAELAMGIRWG